jgi:hypothetical protein
MTGPRMAESKGKWEVIYEGDPISDALDRIRAFGRPCGASSVFRHAGVGEPFHDPDDMTAQLHALCHQSHKNLHT